MQRFLAALLSLLLVLSSLTAFADSLSITAWQTGDALNSTNLNARMNSISTWANGLVANDNIKSTAAIVGSKLDLTSGTGRISHTTSVTDDAPVFTSAQTWNDAAEVFSAWRLTVTNTNSASTSRLIDLRVGSTIIASISRTGQFSLNPQNFSSGPTTMMDGAWFNVASATMTDNITAASGTAPMFIAYAFQRPAVAAANSSVTTTNAATVFIASAPVAGDNMTLTNRYALWAADGSFRFGAGPHAIGGATNPTAQLLLTGSYTPSSSVDAAGIVLTSTLTPGAVNLNARGVLIQATFNKLGSGTHTIFAGVQVDAPTVGAGAATLTNAATVYITGAPTAATNNYALWVEGGDVRWGAPLVALGGGAAPTFGTIGGSGPATGAQNSWMRIIDSTGATFWVPAWK